MFPNEANIQRQRPQTTTSSFYIRDILRSDSGGLTSSPKFPGYQLPIQPEGTTYYQNGYVSSVPDQISSNPIPCSTVPYSTIYFPSPLSKGVPFDGMIDIRSTDTVPLPVYIRSRSPNGSDSFCRMKKCRRSRTVFTDLQLMGLEKRFESQKYLSTPDRITLAESLGLSQVQVKTWYQNRRMKWKKTVLDECGEQVPIKPKGRPKKEPIGNDSEPAKEPESNMENAQST